MTFHAPTMNTTLFILVFVGVYAVLLIRSAVRERIDVYDLILLLTVGLIPAAFVVFPRTTFGLAQLAGVGFPFLLLFGALLLVVFIMLTRMIRTEAKLRKAVAAMTQEIALLRSDFDAGAPRPGQADPRRRSQDAS
jgi:hypothetical protein